MRLAPAALIALSAAAACGDRYDPPPEIETVNLDRGLYDPTGGPLQVRFTESIRLNTLAIALRLARYSAEHDLTEEATPILGPCTPDPAAAEALDTGVRYTCEGGTISVDDARRVVTLEPLLPLAPFERYTIDIARGLEDESGRVRRPALFVDFQVKSNFPCGPSDFAPGFFFTVFQIDEPISTQFHFIFWFEMRPETGEFHTFGSDIDPDSEMIDPKVDRDPANWHTDPHPPTGATIIANGQIADVDGDRVMAVFPFDLDVTVPRIFAPSAELNGRVGRGMIAGAPGGERETILGGLFAPQVYLGDGEDRRALGAGRGSVTMYRLEPPEAPALADLLARGVTEADVKKPFGKCEP